MSPSCPKCRSVALVPRGTSGAAPGPRLGAVPSAVLHCPACRGLFLGHADVMRLRARGGLPDLDTLPAHRSTGDELSGPCPHGHGELLRALVELDDPFHLDACATCGGIWFDAGEWHRLANSNLLRELHTLSDPARLREHERAGLSRLAAARQQEAVRAVLEAALGVAAVETLAALAQRLRGHETRELLLRWLDEESR